MTGAQRRSWLAVTATVAVVAAIVAGILVLDPPAVQRARRLDWQRVNDLNELRSAVENYWSRHDTLPSNLAALSAEQGFRLPNGDPETAAAYEYRVTGETSYELCATFVTDTATWGPSEGRWSEVSQWSHGAGRQCFTLHVKRRDRVASSPPLS